MNTTQSSPADSTSPSLKSVVETLVGLGTSWAAFGLKIGQQALVHSAETLGKTADSLESLASEIERKGAAMKDATPAENAEEKTPAPPAT